MKVYRLHLSEWSADYIKIEEIEVVRATHASVWLLRHGKERREARNTTYHETFDTFEEANERAIGYVRMRVASYEAKIKRDSQKLEGYRDLLATLATAGRNE